MYTSLTCVHSFSFHVFFGAFCLVRHITVFCTEAGTPD